jgi:putative FmdB family regulatory protein
MPFYEYQCKNCGHELEAMQKVSDSPLKKCPDCGKSQLQRLMSAPVFRLKGGGWYETDFKGDKDNQRNLADRPEADAPKDAKDAKDADAKGKDDKGKDDKGANGKDAKATEKSSDAAPKESAAKEKATDKPAEKSRARAVQKKKKPLKVKRRRR